MIVASILGHVTVSVAAERRAEPVDVGFLEQQGIRAAFRKTEEGWLSRQIHVSGSEALAKAALSFAEPRKWRIVQGGRDHGVLRSEPFARYDWYKDLGLQQVAGPVPKLGFRLQSRHFASWMDDQPVRPVALSTGNVGDPERWRSQVPPSLDLTSAKAELLRALEPEVELVDPQTGVRIVDRKLRVEDLALVEGFRSVRGAALFSIGVQPTGADASCRSEPLGCAERGRTWFIRLPGEKPRSIGRAWRFIDAEDFDGDGISELLFWIARYNRDGYALFVSRENRWIEFTWNYH